MRKFLMMVAASFCLAAAASAQTVEPAPSVVEPTDAAVARIVVDVLAPTSWGAHPYSWEAVSIRISRRMHWHLAPPDRTTTPQGGLYRRNGWVESGPNRSAAISAWGDADRVRTLDFELRRTFGSDRGAEPPEAFAAALRAMGATVEKRDSPNVLAAYTLSMPGKRPALLAFTRTCTNPNAAAMPRCEISASLALLEGS